jgi:3-phenylpropionate/cinnamic acid dioxygenase small subunit
MTNAAIQELADKRALDDLIYAQAMAVDTIDWPAYRKCFADRVDFDFSEHVERVAGKGLGAATDPDQWVENVKAVIPGFDSTMHSVTNVIHEVAGERASSRCFVTAEHFLNTETGDRSITASGIYTFDSIRTPTGWKLQTWRLKILYYRGNPSLYMAAAARVRAGRGR